MAYIVKSGDTLGEIAAANGMSLAQLLELNPSYQANPDLVRVGASINTTAPTSGTAAPATTASNPDLAAIRIEYRDLFGVAPDQTLNTSQIRAIIRERTISGSGAINEDPVETMAGTTIPDGAQLIVLRNPAGSDARQLYYLTYQWRGVTFSYEIGDEARYVELFGPKVEIFESVRVMSQSQFDDAGLVQAGAADQLYGATESVGSRIEREVRAQGLEDIPAWLAGSQAALALVAEATTQGWSSGRLWKELSNTDAFKGRFGGAIDLYLQEGVTIGDAVDRLVADEEGLRQALRPWGTADIDTLHEFLNSGWTPGAAAQVLEQAEVLRRDPESLTVANLIMQASGLGELDEVGFINALAGFGPQDTIEALNTATAARAMAEAGIDLDDADLDLIMDLVDTSDRLLTADSWRSLSQELSLNLIRFNTELDQEKLGVDRDDLVAAAFGQESPTGKSAGETLALLARFERDRRAAGAGFDQMTGFLDQDGRLRVQGVSGL